MSVVLMSWGAGLALSVAVVGGAMALAAWFYFMLMRHLFAPASASSASGAADAGAGTVLHLLDPPVRIAQVVPLSSKRPPRASSVAEHPWFCTKVSGL